MTHEKIKGYLWGSLALAVLIIAISAWNYAQSYSESFVPARSFSVSAEGKTVAIPDIAEFSFGVVTQGGKDIASLEKQNTDKMNSAIAFLKSSNIDAKDIQTSGYSLDPRYQYISCPPTGGICPPAEITGYVITQTVDVKIRDFSKIGDILSGVIQNGANSVSQLSFTLDNPDVAQGTARAEAIKKAQAKAEAVAQAGGFTLGRLLSIDENTGPQPMYAMARNVASVGSMSNALPSPTIEPGSQEVSVDITLRYEIK